MADMSRAASNQEEPSSDAAPSGSVVGPQAGSEETLDVEILGELKDALEMMSSSAWRNNLYQMEPTDPRRKTFREGALIAFNHAFLRTKSLPYLDLTISFAEELVAEFPDTLTYHTMLITFFKEKESLTKAAEDLDKYIRSVEAAISIAPDGPQKREWQSSLQLAHYYRSSSGFSVLDPDKLIATMMSLADINPDDGEKQIQSGWTMLKRYEKDGKVADLITSIKLQEDGLKKLADDDPSHWNAICTLTECYLHLYKREYNPRALDRAIDCMEERATIHLQNSVRAEFRNDRLAYLHMLKFFRKPNSSDLYSALLNYLRRIDSANRVPAKGLDEPDKPKSSLLKKLVYQSLGDSRSNFRLIELMTGVIDSEVTCTLREYTFHESPEYEALSYVWGNDKDTRPIVINGCYHDVTINLYKALNRLKFESSPRLIWADAICINQSDIKEKQHQIEIMADIYERAKTVIMWLGETRIPDSADTESVLSSKGREALANYYRITTLRLMQESNPSPAEDADSPLFRADMNKFLEAELRSKQSADDVKLIDAFLFEMRPTLYGKNGPELSATTGGSLTDDMQYMLGFSKMWHLAAVDAFEFRLRSSTALPIDRTNWDNIANVATFFKSKVPTRTWPTLGAFSVIHLLSRGYHLSELPLIQEEDDLEYPRTGVWRWVVTELNTILEMAYWERAWILQEIVCSTSPVIHLGEATISFDTLYAAASRFELHYTTCCAKLGSDAQQSDFTLWTSLRYSFNRIKHIGDLRNKEVLKHNRKPLFDILTRLSGRLQASDARDIVYGISGVVKKHRGRQIPADYSMDVTTVYTRTTEAIIEDEGTLQILLFSETGRSKTRTLPSWVPDYHVNWKQPPLHYTYHNFNAAKDRNCAAELQGDLCLQIQTVAVDKVRQTSPGAIHRSSTATDIVNYLQDCRKMAGMKDHNDKDDNASTNTPGTTPEDRFWRTVFGDSAEVAGEAYTAPGSGSSDAKPYDFAPKKDDIHMKEYGRLDQEGTARIQEWYQWLKNRAHSGQKDSVIELRADKEEMQFANLTSQFCHFANLLTFIVTEKSRVGFGPSEAVNLVGKEANLVNILFEQVMMGDEIHVAYGCRVPLVLRAVDAGGSQSCNHPKGKVYKLIGSCYVDGIMDGEMVGGVDTEASTIYLC